MRVTNIPLIICVLIALAGCATPTPGDQYPVAVTTAKPVYPFALFQAKTEGSALIEFVIDTKGDVVSARVVETNAKEFGEAAVSAIYKWKFKPGVRNGRLVNVRMRVPFYFALADRASQQPPEPTPAAVAPPAGQETRQP